LFRWLLGVDLTEPPFDHSTFSKNRARQMAHKVAREFFDAVVWQAQRRKLLSEEHFTVDGTLIEAWASLKSFKPKQRDKDKQDPPDDPGNPTVNFHGERRSNDTHESTTDPESKLARKSNGTTARLSFSLHSLMENRNGLLVDFRVDEANGTAERELALPGEPAVRTDREHLLLDQLVEPVADHRGTHRAAEQDDHPTLPAH
ncbi:MAG: transposase, partial [Gemmatimonadaceae bacterium]